jgi:hypothetical protein
MTDTRGAVVTALSIAVVVIAIAPHRDGAAAQGSSALPAEVTWILSDNAQFPVDQLAALRRGQVIARTETSSSDFEAWAIAAVRIATPKPRAVDYFHQLLSYVDGKVTLQFGTVGNPPRADDFSRLTVDPDDVDALRECRPGRCDVRIGAAAVRTIGSVVDWRAPDAANRVNGWAREQLAVYVASYLARGDDALIAYDDQSEPVLLRDVWRRILAGSPALTAYAPGMVSYLTDFPRATLAGLTEQIYWDKEHMTGLKPIVFVTHLTTWTDPERPDRTLIAQKQIYASHYFYGSLAVTGFFEEPNAQPPATYVVYFNRSRGDLLKGGFGGIKRRVAEQAAKQSAEQLLGGMKRALEQ